MSPGEWFWLVVELNAAVHTMDWNQADRRFLREEINKLTVSEDAMPTKAEEKWILSIKRELERRRR